MKPSERINEIYEELNKPDGNPTVRIWSYESAIARYLDEEKDRVNEVLHEIVNAQFGNVINPGKRLHQLIDEKLVEPSTPN